MLTFRLSVEPETADLAAATDNRLNLDLFDSWRPMMIMLPRTRPGNAHSHPEAERVSHVQREHAQVADGIIAWHAATAGVATRAHLGNTRRRLAH